MSHLLHFSLHATVLAQQWGWQTPTAATWIRAGCIGQQRWIVAIPLLSSVAKMQTPPATKYRLITIDERCYSGPLLSPRRGGPSKLFLLLVFLLSHSSQDKFELILDSYRIIRERGVRRLRAGCDLRKPKTAFCFFIANNQPRTNTRCAFFIFLRITRESRPPCSLDTTAHRSVRSCRLAAL